MAFVMTQQKSLESVTWVSSVRAEYHTLIEAVYAIAAN